jgi:hypothetical protein
MVFVGKLAYLVLFPGILFVLLAGLVVRALMSGVRTALAGAGRQGAASGGGYLVQSVGQQEVAAAGSMNAVAWLAPLVKLAAIAWISCILMGVLPGDVVLLYALLLAALASDAFVALLSANPRVRQGAWAEAASLFAWAIPFSFVVATVVLRSTEMTVSGIIKSQVSQGVLIASSNGGALARAGGSLALVSALCSMTAFARLRPFGRGYLSGSPSGLLDDVSGPPLSFFIAAETAALFVAALLLVALRSCSGR